MTLKANARVYGVRHKKDWRYTVDAYNYNDENIGEWLWILKV